MGGVQVLRMAVFLAKMHTAIEWAVAGFTAAKTSSPLLFRSIIADCLAFHLIFLRAAQHFRLHFAAVTTSLDLDLAGTTQALMTRERASMLPTWKQVTTYLSTAPSLLIVGILAALAGGISTAEAVLRRPHGGTGSTRTGVTCCIAWVRATFTRS
jgi:hypothetical protein